MSTGIRFLACATLGAILAAISLPSLAASRSTQFVVMVQVLPRCQWSLEPDAASSGRFAIACTRDTGYSISLAHGDDSRPDVDRNMTSGVGTGARQVIPLRVPAAPSINAGSPSSAPLLLTISY